jgi:hypothetical protein
MHPSRRELCVAFLIAAAPVISARAKSHPTVYVDNGACPFECCVYRTWNVVAQTPVYERPDTKSRRTTLLKRGASVHAITGFVRTRAGRFRVFKDHERFHSGDTVWVYTYHGEGYFTVWYKGKLIKAQLDFSPYGGGVCESPSGDCWGKLDGKLQMTWWAKVRLKNGRIAWTNRTEDYGNMDACG